MNLEIDMIALELIGEEISSRHQKQFRTMKRCRILGNIEYNRSSAAAELNHLILCH
jgi:hypothetical protein